jgi:hypothetical protein
MPRGAACARGAARYIEITLSEKTASKAKLVQWDTRDREGAWSFWSVEGICWH